MDGVLNLKNGVTIKELYKDLDNDKIKKIERAAKGGFTADELKSLEEDGIDTSLIKNNSDEDNEKQKAEKTDADVKKKAEEIKEKYCSDLKKYSGDKYTADNPELQALDKAMDDGIIIDLADEGYNKTQIVTIVGQAFGSLGIAATGEDGAYTRPYGHGKEGAEIFSKFSSQLVTAVGEDSEEIKAARAKLASINTQIADNNQSIQVLEVTIEALQDEVEEQIKEAIEKSEDIADEQKEAAKDSVEKRLGEYTSSNGSMSYEDFQNAVSGDLSSLKTKSGRELSSVVLSLVDANRKMGLLKNYVSEISDLATSNETLTTQAQDTQKEVKDLIKEQVENSKEADPDAKCTDPIGFSDSETRYDFFVDKDNNKDITNEKEFLGAKDGFSEMKNLDSDNNGLVSAKELESANVKVIKTTKDGKQEILSASDIFKNEEDGINLSSYQSTKQDIGNGNTLLGTFSATMNGEQKHGYQTLDSQEWLDDNYEFSDEADGKGRFAQDLDGIEEAIDLGDKINIFTIKNAELEKNLKEAWSAYGFSDDMAQKVTDLSNLDAKAKGAEVESSFKEIARKEEEKTELAAAEKKEAEQKNLEEEELKEEQLEEET